jgi:hypothetical protein
MKIARIIIIIVLSVLLISLFLSEYVPVTSKAVDSSVPTKPVVQPTTLPVVKETLPTEPEIEFVGDYSIVYIKCEDNLSLQQEIEKCESYIAELELNTHPEALNEIIRIQEILGKYEQDKRYMNKTIIQVPECYLKQDFKSYEDYRNITSRTSPHYRLQHEYAYTNSDGIRMVNGRYCVALGSYFTTTIGQYVDIVLANGTIIPCILGDQKANAHTDQLHIAHMSDGSIVEFIIDKTVLPEIPKKMGNISYSYDEWQSPVVQVIVYDINEFSQTRE